MFCSNCGKNIPDGNRFCSECGTNLMRMTGESGMPSWQQQNMDFATMSLESQTRFAQNASKKNTKKLISIGIAVAIFIAMIFIVKNVFGGGLSAKSIVGTWVNAEEDWDTMGFYEDGTCLNTPIDKENRGEARSYRLQEDGTLIFVTDWDERLSYTYTKDKNQALQNRDYYYLSGNTLVLRKREYIRK